MTVTREELHFRKIECQGFRRSDGLWDVEGRLVDTKTYAVVVGDRGNVPIGDPIHDMSLRLTLDSNYLIRDAAATMTQTPYTICPGALTAMRELIGLRICAGWLAEVRKRLTRQECCTHLFELLGPIATTAFQTLSVVRGKPTDNPGKINSCYAYSADRALVKLSWPERYTGKPD